MILIIPEVPGKCFTKIIETYHVFNRKVEIFNDTEFIKNTKVRNNHSIKSVKKGARNRGYLDFKISHATHIALFILLKTKEKKRQFNENRR